jgi:hypothetical protein
LFFCRRARILLGVLCPICEKRKANRFCPAKGEKICAVCCGTEREVTIDCPVDCSYLISAHRYEDEHQRDVPADAPLRDVRAPLGWLDSHEHLNAALVFAVSTFCASHPAATDSDVLAALQALAETYRTLMTGIYYETHPPGQVARELWTALNSFISDLRQQEAEQAGFSSLKDSDVFYSSATLCQVGFMKTNGRARSRRYVEFLRSQFPQSQKREESRIIVP